MAGPIKLFICFSENNIPDEFKIYNLHYYSSPSSGQKVGQKEKNIL
jgi:hypothetical protein